MAISIINIVRNSAKFTSINFVVALASFGATIYVATVLVPEEYGIYGLLGLWSMYAILIRPGIINAGSREIPVLLGRKQGEEALRVQNISITAELFYSIIPFTVLLGASFFYTEPVLKFGLIIIAISYLIGCVVNFWSGINLIREKFNIVVKANAVVLVSPLVIVVSVYWLRVYALLIAPLIAKVISGIYYYKKGPINFHFTFDRAEVVRLVKIGVVLQGLALTFWGFRLADRTIIASMLPLEQLGLYVFAIGFLMYARTPFGDFGKILQPVLWKEAGRADSILEGFQDMKRITIYLALIAAILIPVTQLGFYLVVSLITTKYVGSIPIFFVLSYILYFWMIGGISGIVLNSSLVNKQKITFYFYAIGLVLNIIFDFLVIKQGYGVVGVAWVTICTQGLVSFALLYFVKDYIFRDARESSMFAGKILFPFLAAIPFYFLHSHLGLIASNVWAFAGMSLVVQVLVWGLIFGVFYRDYLSISDIKAIIKEIWHKR